MSRRYRRYNKSSGEELLICLGYILVIITTMALIVGYVRFILFLFGVK